MTRAPANSQLEAVFIFHPFFHQRIVMVGFMAFQRLIKIFKIVVDNNTEPAILYSRSMKTCMNISAMIWPTMMVAKATRLSRLSQGCVFGLGLSRGHRGYNYEANLDKPEVSG